eukprot:scaffold584_cov338-Pavlova_lutheri.AAC.43
MVHCPHHEAVHVARLGWGWGVGSPRSTTWCDPGSRVIHKIGATPVSLARTAPPEASLGPDPVRNRFEDGIYCDVWS